MWLIGPTVHSVVNVDHLLFFWEAGISVDVYLTSPKEILDSESPASFPGRQTEHVSSQLIAGEGQCVLCDPAGGDWWKFVTCFSQTVPQVPS
jgi:hypothetical protein